MFLSFAVWLFSLSSILLLVFRTSSRLETSALLVRGGEGCFSRGYRAAVRRSGRHSVGVGTNRQRVTIAAKVVSYETDAGEDSRRGFRNKRGAGFRRPTASRGLLLG